MLVAGEKKGYTGKKEINMKTERFTFLSNDGLTTIHAVKWLPDSGNYGKILQITHGMVERIGRYEDFAKFLTGHGYMVVGMDFLGHGDSVLSEDKRGYFSKKHPSNTLCKDMQKLRKHIQDANPGIPYFILGHSMGSYMLRKYLAFYGTGLHGAIIMGTGYNPPAVTRFGIFLTKMVALVRGEDYRSPLLESLTKGADYKDFDLTDQDSSKSWLSKNEENVKAFHSDPKCQFLFTANGYQGLFEAVLFSCTEENIRKVPGRLPILFVSGDHDPVGGMGKGVEKVFRMFQETGHEDVTCKLYEGDRHEILNELDREQVYEDILGWMEERKD